jgi:crotonobetainyl-CoA:carnitine CoA-transferase CaiB-like acyl-CoA transferase
MAQMAVTGTAAAPMPVRISAWAIYDVFQLAGGEQIFVAVVSDAQWRAFCTEFGLTDLANDAGLAANNGRVAERGRILPRVREALAGFSRADLLRRLETIGVPASVIARPEDLFDDEHLNARGGLVNLTLPDGRAVKLPALPVEMDGERFGVRRDLARAGEDSHDALREMGITGEEIDSLVRAHVIA